MSEQSGLLERFTTIPSLEIQKLSNKQTKFVQIVKIFFFNYKILLIFFLEFANKTKYAIINS